jgi:hypothetical protein
MTKAFEWLREKRGEIMLHVLLITPLISFLEYLGHIFVQPGIVRDVGFYVIIVAVIAGSCFLLVWLDRKQNRAGEPIASTDPAVFFGFWRIVSDEGHSDIRLELKSSFDAVAVEQDSQTKSVGRWEIIGGRVSVVWDSGWRDILQPENGSLRKTAYEKKHWDKIHNTGRASRE